MAKVYVPDTRHIPWIKQPEEKTKTKYPPGASRGAKRRAIDAGLWPEDNEDKEKT